MSEGKNSRFFRTYWQTFATKFYFYFYNNKAVYKFGMIALLSNKKLAKFYSFCNFKNYVGTITNNNEKSNAYLTGVVKTNKRFHPTHRHVSCYVLYILSVYANAAQGLNLCDLFYLNNYSKLYRRIIKN